MGINPISLKGNWKEGFALDMHTISSIYLGEDEYGHAQFDTTRSEIGELIYNLKYCQNKSIINKIIELIGPFLLNWEIANKIDVIIPVPPTNKNRLFQPVYELSSNIGVFLGKPIVTEMLSKNSNIEVKGLDNIQKHDAISGSMTKNKKFLRKVNILIIDDLYKSGETLNESINILKTDPNIGDIYALAMTKTRK